MNKDLKPFLNEQKKQYIRHDRDVRYLIVALGRVLHDFAPHTDADIGWLQDEIVCQLGPKLKKKMEIMRLGGMAALLVGHGSSSEQARKALAQWLLISDTKVRDAYAKIRKEFKLGKGDASILKNYDFRATFIYEPAAFQQRLKKPFPEDYPKAYKAMQAALEAGQLYAQKGPAAFSD